MHFPFLVKIHGEKMETCQLFLRKHPIILVGNSLLYTLLFLAPFVAQFVIGDVVATWLTGPSLGPFIVLSLALYELSILLLFYNAFMDWFLDIWVVTDERIVDVDQNGVFSREIAELGLSKVQDVSVEQKGVLATVFGFGTIRVQSAGEKANFTFSAIPRPNAVARTIMELVATDQAWHREALANEIKGV